ncbi:PREDICTED: uncharacterized protein LOC108745776 isoform X2 [Trachymyrmex septentrionalis]|uniref:uncharacterized protein LOC108745776 isoform X2 n=1 Tax=Trachymyrmex septentrionalis TaxID=34720 RepID=UPI00084F7D3B|nr:PREDICTED: uncharacterized protein LOC108745776 isoform X2 [Trachymyrmex septentrionalis]
MRISSRRRSLLSLGVGLRGRCGGTRRRRPGRAEQHSEHHAEEAQQIQVCGSLGTLLKVKVNSRGGTPRHKPEEPNPDAGRQENQEKPESTVDEVITVETSDVTITDTAGQPANSGVQQKQIDLNEKMGSHLNKLDSLITKAENAQYSMQHQTKQMRKILKK